MIRSQSTVGVVLYHCVYMQNFRFNLRNYTVYVQIESHSTTKGVEPQSSDSKSDALSIRPRGLSSLSWGLAECNAIIYKSFSES